MRTAPSNILASDRLAFVPHLRIIACLFGRRLDRCATGEVKRFGVAVVFDVY